MKSYWYAAVIVATSLALFGCGKSPEEKAAEELQKSAAEMQKNAGDMQKGAEEMAKGFEAMARGLAGGAGGDSDAKPVEPVGWSRRLSAKERAELRQQLRAQQRDQVGAGK